MLTHEEDIKIINIHKTTELPKQMTQTLAELKGEINSYIIVFGYFNKHFQ